MTLFQELKRRNVIRVGAAYVVIGWLLLQVADTLTPALHLPDWIVSAIALLLILGLLPVLLFSWAYELTPDGLRKESEVDKSTSDTSHTARKLDVITLVAVAGLVLLIGWQQLNPPSHDGSSVNSQSVASDSSLESQSARLSIDKASIAVLPFTDLSPNSDQEYFSDGIAEEILNVLVRIDSLKVASRTSAFGFKGQEALGIPVIAERLQVRHVLEGSVRKSGDMVRITAQLIDAQSDAHLWSETFDRTLSTENIFAIQDEIAKAIVEQLGVVMNPNASTIATASADTKNLDAYELYLKAIDIYRRRDFNNIPEMTALYERAVALDPDFALAWASLAAAYAIYPGWHLGTGEDYYPKARDAADQASQIDDSLALPYAIRGVLLSEQGDMLMALNQIEKAVERNPTNFDIYYMRGGVWLELGFLDRAEKDFQRCLELDPDLEICRRFLSFALLFKGKEIEAARLFETGVLRGQASYLGIFDGYYAAVGNESALANSIAFLAQEETWWREPIFKLHTNRTYSLEEFEADVQANAFRATGERLPDEVFDLERYLLPTYFPAAFFWNQYEPLRRRPELFPDFEKRRLQLMHERGVVAYWEKMGFPPQCRPVGSEDFACD